jgi:two-component system OmpR family sensor kinase
VPEPRHPLLRGLLILLPLAAGGAVWVAFHLGLLRDGRFFVDLSALDSDWWFALGACLSAAVGVVVLLLVQRDRRWRQRLEEQSAASARDRRRLLSRLDHELKNPLTAMRAALANVSATVPGSGSAAGFTSIEAQVLRLSRLTADLRKIADVESSQVDRRPVDVDALVAEAVETAEELPAAADRRISVDLPRAPWPLPPVVGDADLLSLAVTNLVDNAVKYTAPGDRIEVRAREAAGQVVIEVADTGPGIAPEDLPHIWEELYRGSRGRAVPGSGLGLALVRAVVERHGGRVAAESRLGHGTVVRIRLPAGAPPEVRASVAAPGSDQKAAEPAT